MAAGARGDLYAEVDAKIERLRTVAASRLEGLTEPVITLPKPAIAVSAQSAAPVALPVDPTLIFENVRKLTLALKASNERCATAEERARRAEACANQAEQWLRRLHEAVQESMRASKLS